MAKHVLCHLCEDSFTEKFRKLEADLEVLRKQCEEYYLSLARTHLEHGDIEGARALVRRCPDHVTNCFILDMVRQAAAKDPSHGAKRIAQPIPGTSGKSA